MKEELILKLFEKFEKGKTVVMHIKEGDCELLLKKEGAFPKSDLSSTAQPTPSVMYAAPQSVMPSGIFASAPASQPAQVLSSAPGHEAPAPSAQTPTPASAPADDKNLVFIKSPIVGTFYRAPSPDSPPFVEKGTKVKKGQPLCVLEAMKMMNTLECDYDGIIEDILASNGDLVEFDQSIFSVRVQ